MLSKFQVEFIKDARRPTLERRRQKLITNKRWIPDYGIKPLPTFHHIVDCPREEIFSSNVSVGQAELLGSLMRFPSFISIEFKTDDVCVVKATDIGHRLEEHTIAAARFKYPLRFEIADPPRNESG